jgi:hypothetical protein
MSLLTCYALAPNRFRLSLPRLWRPHLLEEHRLKFSGGAVRVSNAWRSERLLDGIRMFVIDSSLPISLVQHLKSVPQYHLRVENALRVW